MRTLSNKGGQTRGGGDLPAAGPHRPLCAAPPWLAAILLGCFAPGPGQLPPATAQLRVAIEPTNVIRLGSNNEIKVRVWIDGQQNAEVLSGGVELTTFFSDGEDGVFDVDLNSGRLTPKKEGTGWVAVAARSQLAMVQVVVLPEPVWDRHSAARSLRTAWPELRPQRASFISLEQFLGDLFKSNDPNDPNYPNYLWVDFLKKVCDQRPGRVALGGYQRDSIGFPTEFPVALKLSDELADPNAPTIADPNALTIRERFELAFDKSNGTLVSPSQSQVLDRLTKAALDRFIQYASQAVQHATSSRRLRTRVVEGLRAAHQLRNAEQSLTKQAEGDWVKEFEELRPKLEPLKTLINLRDKLPSEAQRGPHSGFLDYPETLTLNGLEMVLIVAPPGQIDDQWHVFYIDDLKEETNASNIEEAREALKNRDDGSRLRLPTCKEWIAAARHLQVTARQSKSDEEPQKREERYRRFIFGRKEWCEEDGKAFAMGGVTMKLSDKDQDLPPLPEDMENSTGAEALNEWLENPLVIQPRGQGDGLTCVRAVLPITGAARQDAAQ